MFTLIEEQFLNFIFSHPEFNTKIRRSCRSQIVSIFWEGNFADSTHMFGKVGYVALLLEIPNLNFCIFCFATENQTVRMELSSCETSLSRLFVNKRPVLMSVNVVWEVGKFHSRIVLSLIWEFLLKYEICNNTYVFHFTSQVSTVWYLLSVITRWSRIEWNE